MMLRRGFSVLIVVCAIAACAGESTDDPSPSTRAESNERTALIELWSDGVPAFGIFVPNERERDARGPDGERLPPVYSREGGERMARNHLLDYVFLDLERRYDAGAVSAIAEGLAGPHARSRKTLLVRIPPISADGADAARARVAEALADGADGVVFPHVRSLEEARMAVGFFEDVGADVWSPTNPAGTVLAMLMIEDAGALAATREIADTPGYSVLACGIGSLSRALGDRVAGEAGNMEVLAHAQRVNLPDMITANADDVARRIEEGFLGLLMNGPDADAHIEVGLRAAGRWSHRTSTIH